jgi:hypothetical protein
MFADIVYVFFRNGTEHPVAVARSNTVTFEHLNQPLQGHLARTPNPKEMRYEERFMRFLLCVE